MCGRSFDIHFFFQAEDGIRDVAVTGVQTCALPISSWRSYWTVWQFPRSSSIASPKRATLSMIRFSLSPSPKIALRSEERRVGKECRPRWAAAHEKKKKSEEVLLGWPRTGSVTRVGG